MSFGLPPALAERVAPGAPAPRTTGFIVYWMRLAVRAVDNPALDVALCAGRALKLPVFVYQALDESYRYASDRHHAFVLEGARDVSADLAARGIGHAFHLARPGHRGRHLETLARAAALVVTEDVPVAPLLQWTKTLAAHAPVWAVDASCVVPFRSHRAAPSRAFEFRAATQARWNEALLDPWVDVEPAGPAWLPELPFEPVDLAHANFSELISSCDIDHSVPAVAHTPGGARAGEERWEHFLEHRLDRYASERDHPLKVGTSRMSAYLHHGHVSPFRLARDAQRRHTAGSAKFLDELLVWRELAWAFCAFEPRHQTLEALPAWAQQTLAAHSGDPRPHHFSYEQLCRAQTGEPLWDAAQRSLLQHGELHNSVRMTWGKAVLSWTRTPAEALSTLIDLNHRYALDGRDPGSYGGLLWCLGGFDRPFSPEVPVLGQVRPRALAEHAGRFEVAEYGRRVRVPARGEPLVVAVVGGGVAGLSCARALHDAGHSVRVFDKGRAAGGRLSTTVRDGHRFDVGAQFFTVDDARFGRFVRAWLAEGSVARWTPRGDEAAGSHWWVGVPGMSAVVERLAVELDVRFGVRVDAVVCEGERWHLLGEGGASLGEYDALVLATPLPQSAELLEGADAGLAARCARARFSPCWAAMAAFDEPLPAPFDVWRSEQAAVAWAARDSSKPGRPSADRWVLDASPRWSEAFLEATPDEVGPALLQAFFSSTDVEPTQPSALFAHRWRYAKVEQALAEPCLFEPRLRLAVCSDGCLGPGVEAAFLSGQAAAGRLNALPGPAKAAAPARRASQLTLL